eukprot:CAMPEP_0184478240 /NCGR_PEP_ID=MMETSP0113_2-20130426/313_1 /TAXON_ID=91329 /ORGANISM="Norrisiella sphaerica, Strain BC52" /LENGTH=97 /DNA_ID=CAMNT_0026855945 /DNA_START=40 /DNA_END=333 /DNA_ORIENTATION=-
MSASRFLTSLRQVALAGRRQISTRSSLRAGDGPYSVKKNSFIEGNAGYRDFLNESFSLSESIVPVVIFAFVIPIGIYKAIHAEQVYYFGEGGKKKFF